MSGDPEQDYFADGITEDIITGLSKLPDLFVIARNSTFTYKGQSVAVSQVARDLGVRYVLEGSVRKAGNRLRITAQFIDGMAGDHLWAEKFDRDIDDIFDLQDEITLNIISSIRIPIYTTEAQQTRQRNMPDLTTWGSDTYSTAAAAGSTLAPRPGSWLPTARSEMGLASLRPREMSMGTAMKM
jgi:TolB-like protein